MTEQEYISAVDNYSDMLFRISFNMCRNKFDAEDIVQTVFLKLLKYDGKFTDSEHLKRWLIRVAINEGKSVFRAVQRRNSVPLEESILQAAEKTTDITDEKLTVISAVLQLPQKYRAPLYLYYYEDYSIAEISKILNVKETTIQTQLMRARKKLREKLSEV
ncbi:MAG: RNA polymerase sigma factor [Acutalibacteraceae bacterium]